MPGQSCIYLGHGIVVGTVNRIKYYKGIAGSGHPAFVGKRNCTFEAVCKLLPRGHKNKALLQPSLKTKNSNLNNLTVLSGRKKSTTRLNRNSKLFKVIIKAIQEKKGEQIVSLDLRKIPEAVADFFIICEASNTTQLKAIADSVEDQVKQHCGERPFKHEGRQALQWILIDYINIVVHIMLPEPRKFYQLEEMWSDAPVMEHND
jgi:ribosome-associated protein